MAYKRPTAGDPGSGGNFAGQEAKDYRAHVSNLSNYAKTLYAQQQQSLLDAQRAAAAGSQGGYGGGGYGGGGGGYGGGGGGGYKPFNQQPLKDALNTQRGAARKALPGYLSQFNKTIGTIGKTNKAETGQYSREINALMNRLIGQQRGEQARLAGDLGAQGAALNGLTAAGNQGVLGAQTMGTAQDVYNKRLAQLQAVSQGDAKMAGSQVNLAAQSGIDQSYMQALMQIMQMR